MNPFEMELGTRLIFGAGAVDRLGGLVGGLGARRVLLVTDPGLVRAGHVERAEGAMTSTGLEVIRFDGVRENPTTTDVDLCLATAQEVQPDLLVGLGGGSSIDVAKGANLLLTNGGRMQDYRGVGRASGPMLPLIAIPTTAGTGSEMQSFALVADSDTHRKMACGDSKMRPRIALLDPTLTTTQPAFVTACTGLDALGHAVETAVTRRRNAVSDLFSREAFRMIDASFLRVLQDPGDVEARGRMLLASAYAGIAIENSMLGAAHSMANPLTARCGIPHGQAVGVMLPHVVRFNGSDPATAKRYAQLVRAAGLEGTEDPVDVLAKRLEILLDRCGVPVTLAACGVPASATDDLAAEAATQWTAQFNPRAVTSEDLATLLREAFGTPH